METGLILRFPSGFHRKAAVLCRNPFNNRTLTQRDHARFAACSLSMAARGYGRQQAQQILKQNRKETKMEQYIFDKS